MRSFLIWWNCFLGVLLLLAGPVQAQFISMDNISGSVFCGGTQKTFRFAAAGSFRENNVFKVQVSKDYGPFTDLPESFTAGPATVTLPEADNGTSSYRFRIASTNPQVFSYETQSIVLTTASTAELTGNSTGGRLINPYDRVSLYVKLEGVGPHTLLLSDSSRHVKSSHYGDNELTVTPAASTTYTLASVQNACGLGTVKAGSTTVRVNRTGFQVTALSADHVCLGSKLLIHFASQDPLPTDTRFVVELTNTENNRVQTFPLQGSVSPLELAVSDSIEVGTYGLKVRSDSAGVEAAFQSPDYSGAGTVTIGRPPVVRLFGSAEIRYGQTARLDAELTGKGPMNVTFTDGSTVRIPAGRYEGHPYQIDLSPQKTTTYAIRSVVSECGTGSGTGNVSVVVRPGVRIDSVSVAAVCAGQTVTAYYTAGPAGEAAGPMYAEMGYGYSNEPLYGHGRLELLSVTPKSFLFRVAAGTPAGHMYLAAGFGNTGTGPIYRKGITVRRPPSISLTSNDVTLESPQVARLNYIVTGGMAYTFTLSDGSVYQVPNYSSGDSFASVNVLVSQTTSYSVTSISNACGVGTVDNSRNSFWVTVRNPAVQSIVLRPPSYRVCPGAAERLVFMATGSYGPDNEFKAEISTPSGSYLGTFLASSRNAGALDVTLPPQPGTYRVRIVSTNPSLRSNEYEMTVAEPNPQFTLSAAVQDGDYERTENGVTMVAGQAISLWLSTNTQSYGTIEFMDGFRDVLYSAYQVYRYPTESVTYSVKSITGQCGIGTGKNSIQVTVLPYGIRTGTVPARLCAGQQLQVPFSIRGEVPAGTLFKVQYGQDNQGWEDLPSSGTGSPVTVTIPANLTATSINLRVIGVTGSSTVVGTTALMSSGHTYLALMHPPTAELSLDNGSNAIQLGAEGSATLLARLTGGAPYRMVFSDGSIRTVGYDNDSWMVRPEQSQTYKVVSVSNACGFGTGTGQVAVGFKPAVTLLSIDKEVLCAGSRVTLRYRSVGTFDASNTFSFYLVPANPLENRIALGSTKDLSSTAAFTLPGTIAEGSYTLHVEASAPAYQARLTYVTVGGRVQAQLVGGASLYAGQSTGLAIHAQGAFPVVVILNDGTSITLTSSPAIFEVRPSESRTYRITSVANPCGAGTFSGESVVTVLPPAANTITTPSPFYPSGICAGMKIALNVNTTGTFDSTNVFTVELSDSTGGNFRPLVTEGKGPDLTATIPASTRPGTGYRLRTVSSRPAVVGSTTNTPFLIHPAVTGVLTGSASVQYSEMVQLTVTLTGRAPWYIVLRGSKGNMPYSVSSSPFTLMHQADSTTSFRLTYVGNAQCGQGTASGTVMITVAKITGLEPVLPVQVRAFPNPTAGRLQLQATTLKGETASLHLADASGRTILTRSLLLKGGNLEEYVDLTPFPPGVYVLTVSNEGRKETFRVVRE
ncbi:T9SS type A sorting domain-containing protein [Tellurirhabdus rosea]|uniref:T9SS type A sorting domain-containing protein n=1 Tax=Tellurirhabdus rosea TaxID=2674997 RepID=UPI00225254ED|nr:T9SS type A sorting domain-containing protein [Tellurirhabdus rosea]